MTVDPQATSKVRKLHRGIDEAAPDRAADDHLGERHQEAGRAESVTPSMWMAPLNTTGPTRNGAGSQGLGDQRATHRAGDQNRPIFDRHIHRRTRWQHLINRLIFAENLE